MDTELSEVLSGSRRWTVVHGNCLDVMRTMPDASVDSIVTDPPYGLSREPSPKELEQVVRAWANGEDMTIRGRGFMGRNWDAFVPGSSIWKEALRVLKPGGHLLAFAGSRTVDLMGLAIRLAGFEIRDQLQWLYGSGMPKSLDVSKAIDAAAGAEREVVGTKAGLPGYSLAKSKGAAVYGKGIGGTGDPEAECAITAPATPEAAQWSGWGTGLSPSHEPIIMARKPLAGTVAANVLEHGTGAINVDGCRIEACGRPLRVVAGGVLSPEESGHLYGSRPSGSKAVGETDLGRWPANVVLDEAAADLLDAQTGDRPGMSGGGVHRADYEGGMFGGTDSTGTARGDNGGPSRFFYCAKASRTERDMGLTWFRVRSRGETTGRENDRPGTVHGRAGAGGKYGSRNTHPTVKPDDLMRWLVRLITPPGGVCLDPFAGSGTTGRACLLEGFRFIGCELNDTDEEPFVSIARARIAHIEGRELVPRESLRAENPPRQVSLFETCD
jgi:DNA modification methylase